MRKLRICLMRLEEHDFFVEAKGLNISDVPFSLNNLELGEIAINGYMLGYLYEWRLHNENRRSFSERI